MINVGNKRTHARPYNIRTMHNIATEQRRASAHCGDGGHVQHQAKGARQVERQSSQGGQGQTQGAGRRRHAPRGHQGGRRARLSRLPQTALALHRSHVRSRFILFCLSILICLLLYFQNRYLYPLTLNGMKTQIVFILLAETLMRVFFFL
jgi:hypothetical protein